MKIADWREVTVCPLRDESIYYRYDIILDDGSQREVRISREEWLTAIESMLLDKLRLQDSELSARGSTK